jgi:hypothetical protein
MRDTKPMPHLEIFAGDLFSKRHTWQSLKGRLPSNTCLLITSLDNPAQMRLMQRLGQLFRKNGTFVVVLSL